MKEQRISLKTIVKNQLPEFIQSEYPLISEFLSQYYLSLENNGNCYDIIQNLDQYVKFDNVTNLVDSTILSENIDFFDDIISVESTSGFPSRYGLIQINDEIITYTGITTNTFTGCIRGFSGVTSLQSPSEKDKLVFSESESSSHSNGDIVTNLSILFLKEFFKKLKTQFAPGFENQEFVSELNESLFMKQVGDFYRSKGTDSSFKILFGALYGEPVEIIKPQDYLIKPSNAQYRISNNLVVEAVEGNPENLVNKTLIQEDDGFFESARGIVAGVEKIIRNAKTYYILKLDYNYNRDIDVRGTVRGKFRIHPKTLLVSSAISDSNYLDVDSTIGFPNSGVLKVTLETGAVLTIEYQSKTINQFLQCSGIVENIKSGSELVLDSFAYGRDGNNQIKVRITGVLEKLNLPEENNIVLQSKNNTIEIKTLGNDSKNIKANNWFFNISTNYDVKSVEQVDQFTYLIELYDSHSFLRGDKVSFNNNDTLSGTVSQVINKTNISVTPNFNLIPNEINNIKKNIKKANFVKYPELRNYHSNVQNIYEDLNGSYYVTSSSLPSYLNEGINTNDGTITISQTFNNSDVLNLTQSHYFYTGDAVVYKVSSQSNINIESGIYFVKVLDNTTIKLARSREDIYSNKFESLNGTSIEDTISFLSFNDENLNLKSLNSQKLVRKITSPSKSSERVLTKSGPIGIFVNGVELLNYKSNDSVFYGPIEKIIPTSGGYGYDIINPPQIQIEDEVGTGAIAHCSVTGNLERIDIVDAGFDYIETPKISITGGNGTGAVAEANLISFDHIVSFNSESIDVNIQNDTIGFSTYHKFRSFEEVIYNTQSQGAVVGLTTGSSYIVSPVNSTTIKLFKSLSDAVAGINTIQINGSGTGVHTLRAKNKKKKIGSITIANQGKNYSNRKRVSSSAGINTYSNSVEIIEHNYNSGEIITYNATESPVSGLTSTASYYVTVVDSNSFKLSKIGIGTEGEEKEFYYKTNQYINFETSGTGNHIFNYPEIEVKVSGRVGIETFSNEDFNATLNPVFRGEIDSIFVQNGGINYGSEDIINFNRIPEIELITGSGVELIPILSSDGRIVDVNIQSGGSNYFSYPDLRVIGTGSGAVLTPIITNGIITDVKIISGGLGYDKSSIIQVFSAGYQAKFDVLIKSWNINALERFNRTNLLIDDGILSTGINSKNGLQYFNLYAPNKLREDVFASTSSNIFISDASNDTSTTIKYHSPLIGWAYDGNPIYGPYGYSEVNGNSEVKLLRSGYKIKEELDFNRPSETLYSSGLFIEDYIFTSSGDLDDSNGRFSVTPEFPNGVYAYFCTLNENNVPEFPYVIGNFYNSIPIEFNFLSSSNQDDIDFNQRKWIRNTTPYNLLSERSGYSFLNDTDSERRQITEISNVFSGSVSTVDIINPGTNYKVNDKIIFEESSNSRYATAYVSKVSGKNITSLGLGNTTISNIELIPTGTSGSFIGFCSSPHNLIENDLIILSGFNEFNKISNVTITNNELILSSGIGTIGYTGIVTYFNVSGNLNFPIIKENDIYQIENERIKVLSVDLESSRIRVSRNQNNISGISSYSSGARLREISKKINLNLGITSSFYNYKLNRELYFDPKESLSVETVGITSTLVFSNPGVGKTTIDIPLRTIYIPNHNLVNGTKLIYSNNGGSSFSVSTSTSASPFALQNNSIVYASRVSSDLIGISTHPVVLDSTGEYISLGQTGASLLYFRDFGSGDYHSFKTNYTEILSLDAYKNFITVSVGETHGLEINDEVEIDIKSGISTTIKVEYNEYNRRLVLNSKSIEEVNLTENSLKIENHNFSLGEKLIFTEISPIGGLQNQQIYFAIPINKNFFKLSNSLYDATQKIPVAVTITSSGSGKLASINPRINLIRNQIVNFDLSDSSLSYVSNSVKSAFDFSLYSDNNFTQKFEFSGNEQIPEVSKIGRVGIDQNARLTLRVGDGIPKILYYKLTPLISSDLPEIKEQIIIDTEQKNYNSLMLMLSEYSGKYRVSGITSTTFTYNLTNISPEISQYTQSNSKISYVTSSKTASGEIHSIFVENKGIDYKKLPQISNFITERGQNAIVEASSTNIGLLNKIKIKDIGYNYSSDLTIRPKAKIPKVVKLKTPFIFESIEVDSFGLNYTSSPKIVVFDKILNTRISDIDLEYQLGESLVSIIKNTQGFEDNNPRIIPINNSNGFKINSINFNQSTKNVILTLDTTVQSQDKFPFSVGDEIFIENVLVTNGSGYNSENYNYSFFKITNVGINPGITTNPTITYNLSNFLSSGQSPGFYDNSSIQGIVIPVKNLISFKSKLTKRPFSTNETIFSEKSKGVVQTWDNNAYLTFLSSEDFEVGDKIIGESSNASGEILKIYESDNIFYDVSSSSESSDGWGTESGFLNNFIQRTHDSDYYQYFSYSLKSKVQNSTWNEIVDTLNHTSGFKKFGDLIIENDAKQVGILTVVSTISDNFIEIDGFADIGTFTNFDLAREGYIKFPDDYRSDEIYIQNTLLRDYISLIGNRVLILDDISQFFDIQQSSFTLFSNNFPVFKRDFVGTAVSTSNNTITIENHFFKTGEKITYIPPSDGTGIGITLTTIPGIGATTILPTSLYVVSDNSSTIRVSASATDALLTIPNVLDITSIGTGTTHSFVATNPNAKSLITIDNFIQTPIVSTAITTNTTSITYVGINTISVSGISSIFAGDYIQINDEIAKVTSVSVATTEFTVIRGQLGSQEKEHNASSLVTKLIGNYNIVENTIYFTGTPIGDVPQETTKPDELDFTGITTSSIFSGRVFLKSGIPNDTEETYHKNIVFDDISHQFNGIQKSFTLKNKGQSIVGISTANGIITLNNVFQTANTPNFSNDYILDENSGDTNLVFTGTATSVSYDINNASIPRGGIIVSVGSTGGFGYQPLVSAGGTALVSIAGTLQSISIGNSGSGYRSSLQIVNVGIITDNSEITYIGIASVVNGSVTNVTITNPGSGYTHTNPPIVKFDSPLSYSNLPLVYSSTSSGIGTGAIVDIIVGQESSVVSFELKNSGYGYRNGEKLTIDVGGSVGIPTYLNNFKDFEIIVERTFTDTFSGWNVGDFKVFDPLDNFFDGVRKTFSLREDGIPQALEPEEGSLISPESVLLIFINDVLQIPGSSYNVDGSFIIFSEAPTFGDKSRIILYQGTSSVDIELKRSLQTIKVGDNVTLRGDIIQFQQNERLVTDIKSSDIIETNIYFGPGISTNDSLLRPLTWKLQREDLVINGNNVSKNREVYEPSISPSTNIITNVGTSTTEIFIESVKTFFDNKNELPKYLVAIQSQDEKQQATATATISGDGVLSIDIQNPGNGYIEAPTIIIGGPTGVGTTATASVSISNGIVSTITMIDSGSGYQQVPPVIISPPPYEIEIIEDVDYFGDFGIVSGIKTTTFNGQNALEFDLYIPQNSYLRDSDITNPTISVSGITSGSYFVISNSNTGSSVDGGIVTSKTISGSVIGISSYIDNVYQVASVSIGQTNVPGISGTQNAATVVVKAEYSGLSGIGYSNYYGNYSWGKITNFIRKSPKEFTAYNTLGYAGISTSPIMYRVDPLKFDNYLS